MVKVASNMANERITIRLRNSNESGQFSLTEGRVDLHEVINFFTQEQNTAKYRVFWTGKERQKNSAPQLSLLEADKKDLDLQTLGL